MAQQPNIELAISDLPRPVAHPAAARRWRPSRPGDHAGPAEVPSGPAFGTTGSDPGYALRLAGTLELSLAPGETDHSARAAVAAIGGARAARFGRAPIIADVQLGALVLGYDTRDIPEVVVEELVSLRRKLVAHIDHSPSRALALVAKVPADVLDETPDRLRSRLAAGDFLLA